MIAPAIPHSRTVRSMGDDLVAAMRNGASANPVSLRRVAGFEGWSGLDLPRRVGGADWSALEMSRLFRECGRRDVEYRDLIGAGHARLIVMAGTRRFDPFLRSVASGEAFAAIAITEPEAGSDLHALSTVATPRGNEYRLTGSKQYISRIQESTHFVVVATTSREGSLPRITAFLVPRTTPGLSVESMSSMGMATVSWGKVHLDNVTVPSSSRIGGEGQGLSLFMRHFSYWRTMMAAIAIGSGEAAIDQAAARMRTRDAFGGPIGRFTHLQQALAQHVARLRMAWLLIEQVAGEGETRRWPVYDAAMAKAEAVEIALDATQWAMTVFGAEGYHSELGLEKRYRDLAGLRIADGTTDVLRGQVARAFLGERLYQLSLNRPPCEGFERDHQRRRFW